MLVACSERALDEPMFPIEFDPACFEYEAASFDLDVRTIRGKVTVAGAQATKFHLELRSVGEAGVVRIETREDGTFKVPVLAGTYDVYWRAGSGEGVPRNGETLLQAGVDLASVDTLNVAVPAVRIQGKLLLNGAPWTSTVFQCPSLQLWDARSPDRMVANLREVRADELDFAVIPGVYDIVYVESDCFWGDTVPSNSVRAFTPYYSGVLLRGVDMTRPRVLELDAPRAEFTVELRGAVESMEWGIPGSISLVGLDRRTEASTVWSPADPLLTGVAMPGTYELHGPAGLFPGTHEVTDGAVLTVDVRYADLHVAVVESGAASPWTAPPILHIRRPDAPPQIRDFAEMTPGPDGTYTGTVLFGTYDLVLQTDAREHRIASSVAIDGPTELTAEIEWVTVDSTIAIEGPAGDAALYAAPVDAGLWWPLAQNDRTVATLPRGSYDIMYSEPETPEGVDGRTARLAGDVALIEGAALQFDVKIRELDGPALAIHGEAAAQERSRLRLCRRGDDPCIGDGDGDPGVGGYRLVAGVYDVFLAEGDETRVANRDAGLGCFNVR